MRVDGGTVVTIEYTARVGEEVLDSTARCGPVSYVHGQNRLLPGLEARITGWEEGQRGDVVIPAAEAFGEHQQGLVRALPRASLPADLEILPGGHYRLRTADGTALVFSVVEVRGDEVIADFNSRFAGADVQVAVRITAVRTATAAEQARGYP
jgi:FKBP-type peptidyl-prolyl cis-trans isomerase SlyD